MTVVVTVCNQQHGVPEVLLDRQHGNLRILIDCGTGRKQTAPHTGFYIEQRRGDIPAGKQYIGGNTVGL